MKTQFVKCDGCKKQKEQSKTYLTTSGRLCDYCFNKKLRSFNRNMNKFTDIFPDKIENKVVLTSDE